jgi:hypothetical protein
MAVWSTTSSDGEGEFPGACVVAPLTRTEFVPHSVPHFLNNMANMVNIAPHTPRL